MKMEGDLAEALQRIEDEQRELRSLLEQVLERLGPKKRQRPSRSRYDEGVDLAHLRILLPAAWIAIGRAPTPFTVADLTGYAESDKVLGDAIRATGLDAQRLGSLLARWDGRDVDYQAVRRAGTRDGVAVWLIEPAGALRQSR